MEPLEEEEEEEEEKEEEEEEEGEEEEEEEGEEQENVDEEEEPPQKTKKKRVKHGPRGLWKQDLVYDLVDIIITNDYNQRKLIFVNTKNQQNGKVYEKVLKELKSRAGGVINSHAYLLCNQSRHAFRFVCTKRAHDNNCRISNLVYIRGVWFNSKGSFSVRYQSGISQNLYENDYDYFVFIIGGKGNSVPPGAHEV